MNKISLKNLNLKEVEQLSREQLKSVLGGFTGGTGGTEGGATTADCPAGTTHCYCEGEYRGCRVPVSCISMCGVNPS